MLQFQCANGSGNGEDKEQLFKVEAISINVADKIGDIDGARVALFASELNTRQNYTSMVICKAQLHE